MSTVDENGFRPNVGIIIANHAGDVLWARRVGMSDAWQFPQGGINLDETPEQALYRELNEEVGLEANDVRILGCTRDWLHYRLPSRLLRHHSQPLCVGQKQKWFLLELLVDEKKINVQHSTPSEFDRWQWVSFWYPLHQVVNFKKDVYRRALKELAPKLINLEAM
jgi:putative (di)nucleoside polyphosphate hydrolase